MNEIAGVTIMALDPSRDARAFFDVLDGAVAKNLESMSTGDRPLFSEYEIRTFGEVESDASHFVRLVMAPSSPGPPQEIIRAIRGHLMVEIQLVGVHREPAVIAEIMEEVFRRYDEATEEAGTPVSCAPAPAGPGLKAA